VTSPLTISITVIVYQVTALGFYEAGYVHISGIRVVGFVVVAAASIRYAVLSVTERLRPLTQQAPDPSPLSEQKGGRTTIEGGATDQGGGVDMLFPLLDAEAQSTASP
ncbi:unnamed protein product, partial [Laminaria digitata]